MQPERSDAALVAELRDLEEAAAIRQPVVSRCPICDAGDWPSSGPLNWSKGGTSSSRLCAAHLEEKRAAGRADYRRRRGTVTPHATVARRIGWGGVARCVYCGQRSAPHLLACYRHADLVALDIRYAGLFGRGKVPA